MRSIFVRVEPTVTLVREGEGVENMNACFGLITTWPMLGLGFESKYVLDLESTAAWKRFLVRLV
jgi:hypothetical protein